MAQERVDRTLRTAPGVRTGSAFLARRPAPRSQRAGNTSVRLVMVRFRIGVCRCSFIVPIAAALVVLAQVQINWCLLKAGLFAPWWRRAKEISDMKRQ